MVQSFNGGCLVDYKRTIVLTFLSKFVLFTVVLRFNFLSISQEKKIQNYWSTFVKK